MKYRRFGKTHLHLSVFSLGTMRYLQSAQNAEATLLRAFELGINHIETAQGYGQSEVYLGQMIQALGLAREEGCWLPEPYQTPDANRLYITTKITPQPDAQAMAEAIDRSLERLGLETVDCLALHGLNTPEHLAWVQEPQGCMRAVQAAKAAGRIRHIGFSTHGSLALILAALETDLFEFVNLHYNVFFQRNAPAVELANQKEMGIFIISPADKGGLLYTPPEQLQDLCQPLAPLHINARFLLSQPAVTTLSVGAAKPEELDWPLAIADQIHPLTDIEQAILNRLQTQIQTVPNPCQQCYACLPCPENINIPEVLRLRNLTLAYNMEEFGRYRYRMFENAGHWFPGRRGNRCTECGDCLPRCPEHLNIPALLQETHGRLQGQPRPRLWESI
ncbi:aldo/keto reductase [Acaryochloris sp. IP29b_bin.148]|uniref:aldo/keto reductase n=1 Tax=Acaryochloris sp. IP29b_bin.148 TaxID=2969218 RepID=UPI002628A6A4|nr:aldo/keto reductase [Acaryochloris sp. IP29b_bin.148]